jgi:predicted helicase
VFADEAHRCAGNAFNDFVCVLDDTKIRARKKLFLTATPTAIKLRKNAIKNNAFSRVFENSITFGQTTFCMVDCGVVGLSKD